MVRAGVVGGRVLSPSRDLISEEVKVKSAEESDDKRRNESAKMSASAL